MLRLLADHNFNQPLLNAVRKRSPKLDVMLAREEGVDRLPDPELLEWAAARGLAIITHDVRTMPAFSADRMRRGDRMSGPLEVDADASAAIVVEDILLPVDCYEDLEDQII